MATAWLDEERPELLLARGLGRPLWLGRGKHELFFASTRVALQLVESYAAIKLRKSELPEGTVVAVEQRQDRRAGALPAGPFVPGRAAAAVRSAGSRRGPFVPRARLARSCTTSYARRNGLRSNPRSRDARRSRRDLPSSSRRSLIRNWKVDHAPLRASNIR